MLQYLDKEENVVFYLIEPSIEGEARGKEEKLTLFFTLPKSELPDTITTIAAVAFLFLPMLSFFFFKPIKFLSS